MMNLATHSVLVKCVSALGLPALLGAAALLATPASALTISSTVNENNGLTTNATDAGNTTPDGNQDVYDGTINHPGVLTSSSTGYNFGTSYKSLTQINSLSITLTMLNGSSATAAQETAGGNPTSVDDYDVNELVLYLGGTYNSTTGTLSNGTEVMLANGSPLYLNGFLTDDAQSTISLVNISISTGTGSAILTALTTGAGKLAAYVGSLNPNDSSPAQGLAGTGYGPAEIFLGNSGNAGTANATTTLSLSSVPEPGALTWILATGALLVPICRARSRRPLAAATRATA